MIDVTHVDAMVARAREAAAAMRVLPRAAKDAALLRLAELLEVATDRLLEANAQDVADAEAGGQRAALVDRLRLTPERIRTMARSVRDVVALPDPVGEIVELRERPNGMRVGRMRTPIGVILMIYEARPNVTVDAAALCVKAGNAAILRGGREARRSNAVLADLLARAGLPEGTVQVIAHSDHDVVTALLRAPGIDLCIPRGSERLIRSVVEHARMPVLKHFKGVCHLFVDRDADLAMAVRLAVNAKAQRPSVCNALETLLVDAPVAATFLPQALEALAAAGVEVRADAETLAIAARAGGPAAAAVRPARDEDWATEYLDYILNVRVVDGLDEALAHIQRYSTGLADAIVTRDEGRAQRFLAAVDSAAVLVNASTRLVDGGEFGLGAEIGISTDRIGPRGPMGVAELTSLKWVVLGSGQIRA
ncbi:MAG: glutamate-5-semialdehyde dehydrogenase [Armatimonadota bacterium]|nr:glutamate-5-semialdehyde dehydrogenase [Armatimonadota bacterium]MDR7533370.1 glutamate-5-semialdehyde dehydrogenase [Armatimonadota bacterium]MDR7536490.1 glutamate-5-semialdehyde dehydrogenase [Armatimonadota bacterium]